MTPHLQGADARASRPRRSVFWLVSWEHLHRFYHAFLPWNIWHMGISRKFSRKPIQWLTLLNQWMVYPYVSSIFCKCFVSCACPKVAMIVPRFSSAEDSATWCIDKWKQHLQRNQVRVWKKKWFTDGWCMIHVAFFRTKWCVDEDWSTGNGYLEKVPGSLLGQEVITAPMSEFQYIPSGNLT